MRRAIARLGPGRQCFDSSAAAGVGAGQPHAAGRLPGGAPTPAAARGGPPHPDGNGGCVRGVCHLRRGEVRPRGSQWCAPPLSSLSYTSCQRVRLPLCPTNGAHAENPGIASHTTARLASRHRITPIFPPTGVESSEVPIATTPLDAAQGPPASPPALASPRRCPWAGPPNAIQILICL